MRIVIDYGAVRKRRVVSGAQAIVTDVDDISSKAEHLYSCAIDEREGEPGDEQLSA